MPAKLNIALAIALVAASSFAAPRITRFRVDHPTNETEVLGVKMPPRLTEKQWQERQKMVEDFRLELQRFDDAADDLWHDKLTDEQRKALRDLSATNEINIAMAKAKAAQAEAENAWFTNRLAYVTRTVEIGKRRIERYYADGCTWNGSQAVKSTVTTAERGRIVVEILYTADGKKRRVEPIATRKEDK